MTQLPVGQQDNFKFESVKKGDLLKLVTGEIVTFVEMKRTRFAGTYNGGGVSVPLYQDRGFKIPFVKEIVGHNPAAAPKVVKPSALVPGNLFILEGKKGTYMFKEEKGAHIHGLELSTNKMYRIRKGDFNLVQIHLEKVFKNLVG